MLSSNKHSEDATRLLLLLEMSCRVHSLVKIFTFLPLNTKTSLYFTILIFMGAYLMIHFYEVIFFTTFKTLPAFSRLPVSINFCRVFVLNSIKNMILYGHILILSIKHGSCFILIEHSQPLSKRFHCFPDQFRTLFPMIGHCSFLFHACIAFSF